MHIFKFLVEVVTKMLMVQILVVVANILTILLKTMVGGVPCEQYLDIG